MRACTALIHSQTYVRQFSKSTTVSAWSWSIEPIIRRSTGALRNAPAYQPEHRAHGEQHDDQHRAAERGGDTGAREVVAARPRQRCGDEKHGVQQLLHGHRGDSGPDRDAPHTRQEDGTRQLSERQQGCGLAGQRHQHRLAQGGLSVMMRSRVHQRTPWST